MISLVYFFLGLSLCLISQIPVPVFLTIQLVLFCLIAFPFLQGRIITSFPLTLSAEALFSLLLVGFCGLSLAHHGLRFANEPFFIFLTRATFAIAFVISLYVANYYLPLRDARTEITPLRLLIAFRTLTVLFFGARILTLYSSPRPESEIFQSATLAISEFMAGINPYAPGDTVLHESLGMHASVARYQDWPSMLFWISPFFEVFKDVRVGVIIADVIVAITLTMMTRSIRVKTGLRWLLPLAWLCFPAHLMLLESGSFQPVLVMGACLMLVGMLMGNWIFAGMCLGLVAAAKPYAILFAVASVAWVWFVSGKKAGIRFTLSALFPFLTFIVPFFSIDPASMWNRTVATLAIPSGQEIPLSIPSYVAARFHYIVPFSVLFFARFAVLIVFMKILWDRRGDFQRNIYSHDSFLQGLVILFLGFFLFGYSVNPGDYYFVGFLALMGLGVSLHRFRLN